MNSAEGEAPKEDSPESTPESFAEHFRAAAREAGEVDSGLLLIPEAKSKARPQPARQAPAPATPAAKAPLWTADGIGAVVASGHDMAFKAFDLPELEPEEHKQIAEQSARALNASWPTGAKYEPQAAWLLAEAAVIVPRVAAYQMRRKEEKEKAETEKKIGDGKNA